MSLAESSSLTITTLLYFLMPLIVILTLIQHMGNSRLIPGNVIYRDYV